ncbi:uncharacterized protein STEHIDRAFT_162016 [Stereum hirsutum FP-91666 SS1]|uniref:uncharacterized protein n=1 Tax=Stereum hirsutum (strain FP-91666) TaxID=721885 RepID=UPI000444A924|nr:uncharacterized protein STEHIDRAFT_162016 [Stereum hirsutum FP-91666 SS1]EIM81009.1 hypothetical protein STEHIDRAFT_162016 [Stereum hirsutum FP-91666 SS1]
MLLLTVRKIYSHVGEMRRLGQTTISRIILRDGVLYYIGIFLIAVASGSLRIVGVTNPNLFGRVFAGILTPFFSVIPNVLVNRLFLNLRSYQNPSYGLSSSDTTLPAPVFAQNRPNRFLGNIGEPLDYGQWDDVLDEEGVDDGAAENKPELNDIRDPLTTLVPVVYEGAGAENIEMVFMQRDTMPSVGP